MFLSIEIPLPTEHALHCITLHNGEIKMGIIFNALADVQTEFPFLIFVRLKTINFRIKKP